jgi:hypothetical protein
MCNDPQVSQVKTLRFLHDMGVEASFGVNGTTLSLTFYVPITWDNKKLSEIRKQLLRHIS